MKFCQVRPIQTLTNKYRFIKSQLKNYWFWQRDINSDCAGAWSWSRHLCKEHSTAFAWQCCWLSPPPVPVSWFRDSRGHFCSSTELASPWWNSALPGCALTTSHLIYLEATAVLSASLGNRTSFIPPFDPTGRIWAVELGGYKKHPSDLERDPACKAGLQSPAHAARVLQDLALLSNVVLIKTPY